MRMIPANTDIVEADAVVWIATDAHYARWLETNHMEVFPLSVLCVQIRLEHHVILQGSLDDK